MKTFKLFFVSLFFIGMGAHAQFTSARLQAAGLTCAMCTRAINESLKQISFIESVKPDIKNSEFIIAFKQNASIDPDELKRAVEDAGFSVAKLKLTGKFNNVMIRNDAHLNIEGKNFHFLNVSPQTLNGEKTIVFVDKNFVSAKEFKKFATATQMPCIQTGKTASCCISEGVAEHTRIYHVTI